MELWGLIHAMLNCEPFEEVDCLKWRPMENVKGMWYME